MEGGGRVPDGSRVRDRGRIGGEGMITKWEREEGIEEVCHNASD